MAKKGKAANKASSKGAINKGTKRKKGSKRKTSRKSSSRAAGKKQVLIALGIIAVVTFVALSPVLNADFVDIDDKKLILDKGQVMLEDPGRLLKLKRPNPHYKPVTYATWIMEYRLAGDKPFIYHFNNLLLHILNCILVFFIARRLSSRFELTRDHGFLIAFFSALLFGLHPMHVESVAWVVERKDVLYTFFYLASLAAYIRHLDKPSPLYLAISSVLYLLSVFSKSPGITLIAILFLFDFAWQRKLSAKLFIEKSGHFIVLLISLYALGFFRRSGEGSIASMTNDKILARSENVGSLPKFYGKIVLGSMRAWLWYFHSLIPVKLSLGYPREAIIGFFGPLIHAFPVMLVGAGAYLTYNARKYRLLFFAHAFFFITLIPAIVRLGLGIGIFMSDRYVYLSVFGLIFLFVSWIITLQKARPKVRQGILVGLSVLFAVISFSAARTWEGTEALWTNVMEKYPKVGYAYVNRGAYYREVGEYDRAISDLNLGVEIDDNANARIQRGLALRQSGNAEAALADYNKALEHSPGDIQALVNRGNALLDNRQFRQAIEDFNKVLADEPNNVRAAVNRAIAYASLGDFNAAEASFAAVEQYAANRSDFWMNRAIMFVEARQYQKALNDYDRYLMLRPDDHQIFYDKGIVHGLVGQHQKAVESYTNAINLNPNKLYYSSRAKAYDALGNASAAQADRALSN